MILESGLQLGDYEILGLVGEGAMGKVYRARDRSLGRQVALKVLSQRFIRQEDQLARFQREARVLASLNHPNIAIIHGLGSVGDTRFIVLELIEGETLAAVIARGKLPIRRTMELSLQLADALEAAHARGIVHRDLKPANLKVTPEGKLKVLDFGIAKGFLDESHEGPSDSNSRPDDVSTETGIVLGTVGYMSPEQARGLSVDGRSDIWAFGCVLFELLTNKRAFRGKTPTDTLTQVLEVEPHWKSMPAGVPSEIERLLRRCLRKDRGRRQQSMGDARIEIEDVLDGEISERDSRPGTSRPRRTTPVLLSLLGVVAGFVAARVRFPAEAVIAGNDRTTRFSFALPDEQSLPYAAQRSLALAPDGSRLAFVVQETDGPTRIYQRPLDRLESYPVADTEGARELFFSPDSKWLGFFTRVEGAHRLERSSFEGGIPVVFHEESLAPRGGAVWTDEDEVVFAGADGLRGISSNGGVPRLMACAASAAAGEVCRWPEMLPGGSGLIYTVGPESADSEAFRIVAESSATGERHILVEGGSAARYSRTGHILYAQGGSLFAAPFDPETLQITMPPTRLASDVVTDPETGAAQFAVSAEGTLAFVAGASPGGQRFLGLDDTGRPSWSGDSGVRHRGAFRLSPDGRTIAVAVEERGSVDIRLYDLESHDLRRFTTGVSDEAPVWSPDGARLVFRSVKSGRPGLFVKEIVGETSEVPVAELSGIHEPGSWAGSHVAFTVLDPDSGFDVWALDARTGDSAPLLTATSNETEPAYSPDGGWLAYVSDATGRQEVYLTRSDAAGEALQTSAGGGRMPRWSRDGTKIFYRTSDALFSVEVDPDSRRPKGSPALVWKMEAEAPFEVLPSGGFLVAERPAAPRRIVVVSNFTAELDSH
jgi:serine/threonine protein kinase